MNGVPDRDIPATGLASVPVHAGAAAEAIGTRRFHVALLELAASQVPRRAAMAYHYWQFGAPTIVVPSDYAVADDDPYAAGYFRFDPFYRYWRQQAEPGVVSLGRLTRGGGEHADYMRTMVYDWGLTDEIGVFLGSLGGSALGLFMDRGDAPYGDVEVDALDAIFPLLDGLHRAHQRYVFARSGGPNADSVAARPYAIDDSEGRRIAANEAWTRAEASDSAMQAIASGGPSRSERGIVTSTPLADDFPLAPGGRLHVLESEAPAPPPQTLSEAAAGFFDPDLSPREREVMTQILAGCPNPVIARRLGISPDTVKKHRRKLYDKLDITTERELFTRFLAYVFETRP